MCAVCVVSVCVVCDVCVVSVCGVRGVCCVGACVVASVVCVCGRSVRIRTRWSSLSSVCTVVILARRRG